MVAIQLTHVFIGLSLSEPVTFFTDLLIAVSCCVFCSLIRKNIANRCSRNYWQLFFGTLAVSTFTGGVGHLLRVYTGTNLLLCSWLLAGVAIFFFEMNAMSLIANRRLRLLLSAFLVVKLIVFVIYTLVYGNFTGVKIHAALGLLFVVFFIHLISFLRFHASGSVFIMIGIVLSTLSAFVHSMRFTISERWFNHNDLSHVIVLVSLFILYQGAGKPKPGSTP